MLGTRAGLVVLLLLGALAAARAEEAGLFSGLGAHRHPIGSSNPLAQRFFDQGLTLSFAFNHAEAAHSFRQVQRLDPDSPMGFWGEALVLGPSINCHMTGENGRLAYAALRKARERIGRASPRHREYIEALTQRYAPEPPADRSALDVAYARAMTAVAERHPEDDDAQVLAAEAWMDTTPWDYWTPDAKPKPVTETTLRLVQRVLARNAEHPMANHLLIHAVEAAHPARALPSANRLETLVPGAGHLVHMPSHVYLRVGRYPDSNATNRRAIAADVEYLRQRGAQGLPPMGQDPHNHRFLWFGLTLTGERAAALEVARQLRRMPGPGGGPLQQDYVAPLWTMLRFGMWDEALAEESPPGDLAYAEGAWHFARGMALARRGQTAPAQQELAALRARAATPGLAHASHRYGNSDASLLGVAGKMLEAAVAESRGDLDGAIRSLREAAAKEDALAYAEPAPWPLPVRQYLGAALLAAGRSAEAERVYRDDLGRYPANGWSLRGMGQALRAQGKPEEAARVEGELQEAWSRSDVTSPGSAF